MKVTAAAICALVALTISASVSSASQEASVHLQVRPSKVAAVEAYAEDSVNSEDSTDFLYGTAAADAEQEDSVSESEHNDDDDDDETAAALPKAKHFKTSQRTKTNVTTVYDFKVCVDTEALPWTTQIECTCVVDDAYGAHDFYYRLDNGTYLCNYFCESADRADIDRALQHSIYGQMLASKERADATCYSKYHAKFSLNATKFASEFDYVLSLFEKIAHSPRCITVNQ